MIVRKMSEERTLSGERDKNPSSRTFGEILYPEVYINRPLVIITPNSVYQGTISLNYNWNFKIEEPIEPENPSSRDFGKKKFEFGNWSGSRDFVFS